MTRDCGECQACCTLVGVRERGKLPGGKRYQLDKPSGERCTYQCATGCRIYNEERLPIQCRVFECEWLLGQYREEARPDRSGFVVTLAPAPPGHAGAWAMVYGGVVEGDAFGIPERGRSTFQALLGDPRISGIQFWTSEEPKPGEPGQSVCVAFVRTPNGWEPARVSFRTEPVWTEGDIERDLMRSLFGPPPWPHRGLAQRFRESSLGEKLKLRPWYEKRRASRKAQGIER